MVYLKIFFIIIILSLPGLAIVSVGMLIQDLFNSHKAIKTIDEWREAQNNLKKWYFGSCEKCPEQLKKLEDEEEKTYQAFLKAHSFLKPR